MVVGRGHLDPLAELSHSPLQARLRLDYNEVATRYAHTTDPGAEK